MPLANCLCRLGLTAVVALLATGYAAAVDLPVGPHTPALEFEHFPDRAHAVVWRNWGLVEPDRIATVLGTPPETVRRAAASMGLARDAAVPSAMRQRGYITVIRRNWHLLPYDQLLELLGMTAERMHFILKEDDFLFVKLGNVKPQCEPVAWQEPDAAAQRRLAAIRRVVESHFEQFDESQVDRLQAHDDREALFAFVERLSSVDKSATPFAADERVDAPLRFIHSYFGVFGDPLADAAIDPYPEGLLARLADLAVNGVWMHVVLRDLAPGGEAFPEFGVSAAQRLANLRRLVERAEKYGVGVYLYINEPRTMPTEFFESRPAMAGARSGDSMRMCTSNPQVRRWVADALAHVFRETPGLAGVFTITASENPTNCWSHGDASQCPRCASRTQAEVIGELLTAVAEGVHRGNPDAKVLAWDWGWNGHGDAADVVAALPDSVWLQSVSEWARPFERGGVVGKVGEYSISVVGPGPRAQRHWRLARRRGLRTAAKVQVNNTNELLSLPFLPVADLVARHASNLAAQQVDGTMLSWSFGGYPSPNLRVFQHFSSHPQADVDASLRKIAAHRYGGAAAAAIRQAWLACSAAYQEFPYDVSVLYNGPQHMGPANLLYLKPTGYQSTMVGIPYDDLRRWRGPYPPEVLAEQFEKVAAGWQTGLAHFQRAVESADEAHREAVELDYGLARAAAVHFASAANQVHFILARDKWRQTTDADVQQSARAEMRRLIRAEIALAKQLHELASHDSRIGFESASQYFYVPGDLVEKVVQGDYLLEQLR